jgi:hypothetical protein
MTPGICGDCDTPVFIDARTLRPFDFAWHLDIAEAAASSKLEESSDEVQNPVSENTITAYMSGAGGGGNSSW